MRKKSLFLVIPKRTVVIVICGVFTLSAFFLVCINRGQVKSVFDIVSLAEELNDWQGPVPDPAAQITEKDFIKWMEYKVPLAVMEQALRYDINSYDKEVKLNWVTLIAYSAAKNYGNFPKNKKLKDMDALVLRLENGEKMEDITKDLAYYEFYSESYGAVLNGFVGEYEIVESFTENGHPVYAKKYGLKVYSPVASGYEFSHYRDFGSSRTYGYRRRHLGNDLLGSIGTPIIAVEEGVVEALGWNQYGGWRIGIRSRDRKRYYYYAHLRKDHPYHKSLYEGMEVKAGDVIGYLGMTGYSSRENVNNISTPHLHFGLQIIFDESQKEDNNEIWIDVYDIVNLLGRNKMKVVKDENTKDYNRT